MTEKQDLKNITPLFIFGIPRSGTTLLLSLLDGHPEILADVGESRFFTRYYQESKFKNLPQKELIAIKHLLHMFDAQGEYYKRYLSYLSPESVRNLFYQCLSKTKKEPKDFLESYMIAIGISARTLSNRTKYWVEKTPGNEYFFDKIFHWWPAATYIHVVRDPRDIYSSYITRDKKNGRKITTVDQFVFSWKRSIEVLFHNQAFSGLDRCLLLKYEQLAGDPATTMKTVVKYLGIEDHPTLYQPTKGAGKTLWGGNSASGEKNFKIYNNVIGKWKSSLSELQVREIESLLKLEMRLLGYDLETPPLLLKSNISHVWKNLLREVRIKVFGN